MNFVLCTEGVKVLQKQTKHRIYRLERFGTSQARVQAITCSADRSFRRKGDL